MPIKWNHGCGSAFILSFHSILLFRYVAIVVLSMCVNILLNSRCLSKHSPLMQLISIACGDFCAKWPRILTHRTGKYVQWQCAKIVECFAKNRAKKECLENNKTKISRMQCARPTMKVWCERSNSSVQYIFSIQCDICSLFLAPSLSLPFTRFTWNLCAFYFHIECFFFVAVVDRSFTMLFSVWLFSKNFFLRYIFFCLFEDLFVALLLRAYLHNAIAMDTAIPKREKKRTSYPICILLLCAV